MLDLSANLQMKTPNQISDIHYSLRGKGEVLVLIHGAFINSEIWQYQVDHFSAQYKVLSIDLPSHGKSKPSSVNEYDVGFYGQVVIDLIDGLGITKFSIAGLSLGAMIAQCIAAKVPHRVNGLILVGSCASMRLSILEKTITTLIFPKWMAMWLFGQMDIKQFLKLSFFLTWFMRGNKWLGGPATRQKIRESIQIIHKSEIKKIYAAVHTFRKQDLQKGKFPVLLINGQYDSPVIHYHAMYLKRELKGRSEFLIVPNTGHACNYDNYTLFNAMVTEWLIEQKILPYKEQLQSLPISEKGYTSEYNKLREIHRAS